MIFNTKTLSIKIKPDIKIELPIWSKIQMIRGYSGTGKSYMCKMIYSLKNSPQLLDTSTISIDNIEIWNNRQDIDLGVISKLIIVDRAGLLIEGSKELRKFINNSPNKFIIISHSGIDGIETTSRAVYNLIYDVDKHMFYTEVFWDSDGCRIGMSKDEVFRHYG